MNDIDKKEYEIAVLLKEEASMPVLLKLLSQHGFEIREEGPLKKIQLAYPVEHAAQAHFGFFRVFGAPAETKALEHDLRTASGLLRSLIITLPKDKAEAEIAARSRRPMTTRRPAPATGEAPASTMSSPARQSLSNEAIEKKIEEILQ